MSINPDKLRSLADAGTVCGLSPDEARMVADALEIADEMAWVDIESQCGSPDWNVTPRYYDTSDHDLTNPEEMVRNVRYLDARGLIEHHPEHPEWVRVKEGA